MRKPMAWDGTRRAALVELPAARKVKADAFTLIELMIVVAVLLILVAMLLPSLGKARYEAMLTVCASNMKQVGIGTFAAAGDNDRIYPERISMASAGINMKSSYIAYGTAQTDLDATKQYGVYDEVTECPMQSMPTTHADRAATTSTYEKGYHFFWRYRLWNHPNYSELKRPTDSMTFPNTGEEFKVLAMDLLFDDNTATYYAYTSHRTNNVGTWDENNGTYYFTRWQGPRGAVDVNYAFTDGHVKTYRRVAVNDPRMTRTPAFIGAGWPTWGVLLPPE